jgi:DNA mismatch repair protein MutS
MIEAEVVPSRPQDEPTVARRSPNGAIKRRGAAPAGAPDGPVPSRRQYLDLKAAHPGAILLYRLGDFYETFDEDAQVVARDARITLTSRSFGRSGRVPMAGIPYHALNHYLARLLAAGHTIAIAEQVSPPGNGLVERRVTRVLTPGTVAEPALLPAGENRYLAAVHPWGERLGLAWVDVSTGEFSSCELTGADAVARLGEELARLHAAECLISDALDREDLPLHGHRTRLERWHFEPARARTVLCERFGTRSLTAFGCEELPAATGAAGAILAYLARTNPALLPLLVGLRTEAPGRHVGLDAATRRNLELVRSLKTHGSRGSLLGVLDETRTAMGARTLRRLIGRPLRDLAELRRRQGIVGALAADTVRRAALGHALGRTGDLERLVGRVTQGQATTRDFLALTGALRVVPEILAVLAGGAAALVQLAEGIDGLVDVVALLERAVGEDPEGGAVIKPGYCPELDTALAGARETRHWLAGLERVERERTGIKSLKVGYNKVFGYYIEVTRPNLGLVPQEYSRKQTIATGERFVTTELKEAEARALAADEEIAALERAALARLTEEVGRATGRLVKTANELAVLDALRSLAEVAARHGWVRPELEESETLEIVGGRHPVVETHLAGEAFIPNDCRLGGAHPRLLLVTGPNMGGKSTYLRQVAVIVLLAQIGSFVPAQAARIGLVDRIFTRVGAQDDLAGGSSTFKVEMLETATILHQATSRSLIVLDEVGRGTGTDDGLAIARAVVEDLHGRVGARTLFATHYLELTALAGALPGVANVHAAVLETEERVVFLYAVRPGPADRAYGVQVARLAGLPPWVADRAEALLTDGGSPPAGPAGESSDDAPAPDGAPAPMVAEASAPTYQVATPVELDGSPHPSGPAQLRFAGFAPGPSVGEYLARELRELDLAGMTAKQALDWLYERKERL